MSMVPVAEVAVAVVRMEEPCSVIMALVLVEAEAVKAAKEGQAQLLEQVAVAPSECISPTMGLGVY